MMNTENWQALCELAQNKKVNESQLNEAPLDKDILKALNRIHMITQELQTCISHLYGHKDDVLSFLNQMQNNRSELKKLGANVDALDNLAATFATIMQAKGSVQTAERSLKDLSKPSVFKDLVDLFTGNW